MNTFLNKNKIHIFFVFTLLCLITCNYHFESVNQPDFVDPYSTFDVEIIISLEAENQSGIPYFGIRIPTGWTVTDSVSYSGVLNGVFKYSAMMSDSMETVDSSQVGYHWWVSIGDTVDSLLDGTVSITPRILTDGQTGMFFLDYMLGDDGNGLGFRRSDQHMISVGMPLSIMVTNTNDSGEGSLRQAMSEVSNGGDILFDLSYPATILLDSQLVVDRNVNITGPDTGRLTISGNDRIRVLYIGERFDVNLSNVTISGGNVADSSAGGGIYCINSDLRLENVIIAGNTIAEGNGGGIYCEGSNVWFNTVKIIGNSATCIRPNANLSFGGNGGGIFCRNSNISCSGVTIANNLAGNVGGGIFFNEESHILFDNQSRSNIYSNTAVIGNDLYNDFTSVIDVVLDTFSVLYPSSYYAYLPKNFTFDILNGKIVNADADLYVSSDNGNNSNSGISPSEAIQSVSVALTKIMADSLHPHTIYIDNGRYSQSTSGEIFPLRIPDYVKLSGVNRDSVILDAENTSCVIQIFIDDNEWDTKPPDYYQQHNQIETLTITGGAESGIQCWESSLNLANVTIAENSTDSLNENYGGGITCEQSVLTLTDVILRENNTDYSGGGIMINASQVDIFYSKILNNTALNQGGGIFCSNNYNSDNFVFVTNTVIAKNSADEGGGLSCQDAQAMLSNVTISQNRSMGLCGGIYSDDMGEVGLMNAILWDNYPASIHPQFSPVIPMYSNVQGGLETGMGGNIDVEPQFADTISYYLSETSPCIDAGYPDTVFNDSEDINNPGFALWPAMGTLRNDMGAYGGHGVRLGPVTDIKENESGNSQIPLQFQLFQNYPNPFNPVTMINYQLPMISDVELSIFNILGQKVAVLVTEKQNAGYHQVKWDASDFSSGIYYYQLVAGDYREVKRMILLR